MPATNLRETISGRNIRPLSSIRSRAEPTETTSGIRDSADIGARIATTAGSGGVLRAMNGIRGSGGTGMTRVTAGNSAAKGPYVMIKVATAIRAAMCQL